MSPCLCNSQIVTGKQNTRASRKKNVDVCATMCVHCIWCDMFSNGS